MEQSNSMSTQSIQTQAIRARSSQKKQRTHRPMLWITLISMAVIVPTITLFAGVILFQVFELNLPGIYVYETQVGLKTRSNTVELIDKEWNQSREIQLTNPNDPEMNLSLTPLQLGLWIDPTATADAAYQIGRGNNPLADIQRILIDQSEIVLPVLYFDEDAARQTLESISVNYYQPAENAQLVYKEGVWTAVPSKPGLALDIEATLQDLFNNAFSIYLTGNAPLHLKPVDPEIADLRPVLDQIDAVVAQDLSLEAYDPIQDETLTWSVPEAVKRSWVKVDPDTNTVGFNFSAEKIQTLVNTWEAEFGESRSLELSPNFSALIQNWESGTPHWTTIRHEPTTYRVGPGETLWSISLKLGMPLWQILNANEGVTTNNLTAGMELIIPSKNILLPLPVIPNKRILIDISEQRLHIYEDGDLIATHIVSTGVSDSPTMAGVFQVQTHEINAYASNWDLYMPHFLGIYEAWPGFMNGIHGLPLLSNGQRLWAGSLGSPASYGCIILDLTAAESLYYWADPGVVVEIVQ